MVLRLRKLLFVPTKNLVHKQLALLKALVLCPGLLIEQ